MIFTLEHYMWNLDRLKTQTRRLHRPRLNCGQAYAMCPGRGKPAWWFRDGDIITNPREYWLQMLDIDVTAREANQYLKELGWTQAVFIPEIIRAERLIDMSEADAHAENCASVEEYRYIWNAINKRKTDQWGVDPEKIIYVVEYHVPDYVHNLWKAAEARAALGRGSAAKRYLERQQA